MGPLVEIFSEQISGVLAQPVVQGAARLAAVYLAILWLASAYWTFRDLESRTLDRIAPYLAAAAVLLCTPLAFPLALVAYRIVRPGETLHERSTRDLEALLLENEVGGELCPGCGRATDEEWVRCPSCGTALSGVCAACGGRTAFDWVVCAWCATELVPYERYREPTTTPAAGSSQGAEPDGDRDPQAPRSREDGPGVPRAAPQRRIGDVTGMPRVALPGVAAIERASLD